MNLATPAAGLASNSLAAKDWIDPWAAKDSMPIWLAISSFPLTLHRCTGLLENAVLKGLACRRDKGGMAEGVENGPCLCLWSSIHLILASICSSLPRLASDGSGFGRRIRVHGDVGMHPHVHMSACECSCADACACAHIRNVCGAGTVCVEGVTSDRTRLPGQRPTRF